MATEARLQRKIREALEREFPGSYWCKLWGGPFQPAGLPDLMGVVEGRSFFLEVKRPETMRDVSSVQRRMHDRLRAAGAVVGVVCDASSAIDVVRGGDVR